MKHILITGIHGFIGQHLTRYLLDCKYRVSGIDTVMHEPEFFSGKKIDYHHADITNPAALENITSDIDTVIHLAAIPRNDLRKSWDEYLAVNVNGTENILNEAQRSGVKRFVFVSTVEAAGFGDGLHPRSETDKPNPTNNYGKSKLAAEKIVTDFPGRIERVIIRLPMIYGPGTMLIVPKLFGMVKHGVYPLIGSSQTKMEFCYVENAVTGITLAANHKKAPGNLFYLSDERSYTIREVIRAVARSVGVPVRFICFPTPLAYVFAVIWEMVAKLFPFPPVVSPHSKKPFFSRETVWWTTRNVNIISTEKITATLGYKPPVAIDEGCRRTAAWLKKQS